MSSMNLKGLIQSGVTASTFSEEEALVIKEASSLGLVLVGDAALGVLGLGCFHCGGILEFVSFSKDSNDVFFGWLDEHSDPLEVRVQVTLVRSYKFDDSFVKDINGYLVAVPEYLVAYRAKKCDVEDTDFIKCLLPVCDFDLLEDIADKVGFSDESYIFLNSVVDDLASTFIRDSANTGCLMLSLDVPYFNDFLSLIDARDLHEDGIELDTHVTVAYGFDMSLYPTLDSLPIDMDVSGLEVLLTGVSFFENPQYDVCKYDVKSTSLVKLNAWLKENVGFVTTFEEYVPHVTIAYLKAGTAKKYRPLVDELVSTLKFPISAVVGGFLYSRGDGSPYDRAVSREVSVQEL